MPCRSASPWVRMTSSSQCTVPNFRTATRTWWPESAATVATSIAAASAIDPGRRIRLMDMESPLLPDT